MDNLNLFTGKYQRQLTLRNALIPIGQTLSNMEKNRIITADEQLEANYQQAKQLIDDFHRHFINSSLQKVSLDWTELAEAITAFQADRSDENRARLEKTQTKYRKELLKVFAADPSYKHLFKKELFSKVLPEFYKGKEELAAINTFKNFFTYFSGFNENRKNIYSADPISTAIAYRLIHENFPRFLSDCVIFKVLLKHCPQVIKQTEETMLAAGILSCNVSLEDYFDCNSFNSFLTQDGITAFNTIIGGAAANGGEKKYNGINEYINLAVQHDDSLRQSLRSSHASAMYSLYKQILSKDNAAPFIDSFENDEQLIEALNGFCGNISASEGICSRLPALFKRLAKYELEKIYISGKEINSLSKTIYGAGSWNTIRSHILETLITSKEYQKAAKKGDDAAVDKKISQNYFSLKFLADNADPELPGKIAAEFSRQHDIVIKAIQSRDFNGSNPKAAIKNLLDILLKYYHFISIFRAEDSLDKDPEFYSNYDKCINVFREIIYLYNKARNYATKKPFNEEKFKLNFGNAQLTGGWDANKENDYTSIILTRNGEYYLGIMNKGDKPEIEQAVTGKTENVYRKMVYKYFPDFSKMFIKCAMVKEVKNHFSESSDDYMLQTRSFDKPLKITKEIYDLYSTEYDGRKKFQIDYLRRTGDAKGYYEALDKWKDFAVSFSKAYSSTCFYDISSVENTKYERLDRLYKDLDNIFYQISFVNLDAEQVDKWVEDGQLYLFKIYNKDFAPGSTGRKNLHTLYLESIFDEKNLKDVVVKLNGGAELFFRRKTKGGAIVHAKGSMLVNRTDKDGSTIPEDIYREICLFANGRKASLSEAARGYYGKAVIKTATHDIVKDRRYYEDKFFFHFPITINYKAPDGSAAFNSEVLEYLRRNQDVNIIGIDRGERNLIYMTVINRKGEILDSRSFNTVTQKAGASEKAVNYHEKLSRREQERTAARRSWETIGKIATLKEGYLSAVVHEIARAMVKYNAIVVMEDLNAGFKRMRGGIAEKAVYQKFEKMLIDKLNYLAFKDIPAGQPGGVLKGYQLTGRFESFEKIGRQNGFLFYVPAAFTSKIDPATGFSSVFNFKSYSNTEKIKEFFAAFESIVFEESKNLFTFTFDYKKFKTYASYGRTRWQVSSYGERIIHPRDEQGHTQDMIVYPTEDLHRLLARQNITAENGRDLLPDILKIDAGKSSSRFWKTLFSIFRSILQLRNSSNYLGEGGTGTDYIISPVFNGTGFYDSRTAVPSMPKDADANGAYHIALKGLMYLQINDAAKDGQKPALFIRNEDWFSFVQQRNPAV